jgi:hypothetical protein
MAKNQIVMPGFAAFHVGIQTAEAPTGDSDDDNVTHEDSRDAEPDDNISE